jgi:hypothetical protein
MSRDPVSRPLAAFALLALTLAVAAGCGSEGSMARGRQLELLDSSMKPDAKIVVVEIFQNRAYVAATERSLNDLSDVLGVMDARRGYGSNEAYALVPGDFDPETIPPAMEKRGYRVRVVRVVTRESLAAEMGN